MDTKAAMGSKDPDDVLKATMSITSDGKGATTITREDGEMFTIDPQAERSLVWKFDVRLMPLLALMYLVNKPSLNFTTF